VKQKVNFLPDWIRNWYINLISPAVNFFIKRGVNPNFFTTLGLLLSVVTTYFLASGYIRLGGALILLSGTFDMIDGKVARATNRVTKFGALYDSTLDRYSEVMIFLGLAYYFVYKAEPWIMGGMDLSMLATLAVSAALGGSIMTSYVRARAEGLGLECKVGIMQRPERVVYLGFGAFFHKYTLLLALILIAVLANFTAVQRLYYIWKNEKKEASVA
jgi:CDP-diacylglycerol---glycerol-3-phosphate 3-phosphatidyltransferase